MSFPLCFAAAHTELVDQMVSGEELSPTAKGLLESYMHDTWPSAQCVFEDPIHAQNFPIPNKEMKQAGRSPVVSALVHGCFFKWRHHIGITKPTVQQTWGVNALHLLYGWSRNSHI